MEQETNQTQCECIKKEDIYKSLELTNTWIANMDAKISFALALIGVLIGMVFKEGLPSVFQKFKELSEISQLHSWDVLTIIIVGLLYLVSFSSLICFICAIIARIKTAENTSSLFFFASINRMGLNDYKARLSRITEKEMIEDLKEQVFINSKICTQKTQLYNIGMKLLVATVVLWFFCTAFGLI